MQLTHGLGVYSFEEFKNPFIALTYGAPTVSAKFHRSQKRDLDYDIFIKVSARSNSQYFSGTCVFRILTVRTYGSTFLKK